MSKNHFWKEFSFFLFSFLKFKIFSRIGFKNSIVNFSKKWIFWGLEQLVHRVFFLKQKVFWVLKTQVIFNDLGQWQGRKKLTKKRFSTMVRLSFTCTSALFSTGVVSDSIYFILFSLSPFCFPDQKLRSTQPWKRKGLLRGSNSIYFALFLPSSLLLCKIYGRFRDFRTIHCV